MVLENGVREIVSALAFEAALARVEQAIVAAGLTVFARVDHARGAADAGLTMPPTLVLIYGAAKGGTPVMLAAPRLALDLPLRVLIRADDTGSIVSFRPIADVLSAAGVLGALAHSLDRAQQIIVEALA